MASGNPGPSNFVWYDLLTHDADVTEQFYTQLFGWTVNRVDMGPGGTYRMFVNDGAPFGGIGVLDAAHKQPSWLGHLYTADINNTVSRHKGLGGAVLMGPDPIPGIGSFAVVTDAQGATFSWFQPGAESKGPSARHTALGDVCWSELMTSDLAGAKVFYSELAGWDTSKSQDMGPAGEYVMVSTETEGIAGLMQKPADMPASSWTHYVNVTSSDEVVAKAVALGATVCVPATDVPGMVRFAVLFDPAGAMFGVVQSLRS